MSYKMSTNIIVKEIERSVKKLPFKFTEDDILILSEWGYSLYKDGWENAKILLINKNKKHVNK